MHIHIRTAMLKSVEETWFWSREHQPWLLITWNSFCWITACLWTRQYCQQLAPPLVLISFQVILTMLLLLLCPQVLAKIITLFSIFQLYSSSYCNIFKVSFDSFFISPKYFCSLEKDTDVKMGLALNPGWRKFWYTSRLFNSLLRSLEYLKTTFPGPACLWDAGQ